MEVEKLLTRARVEMLVHHPFWGHLALSLELVKKPDMFPPTMGTDGRKLWYHPDFIQGLSKDEIKGVLAHEIGHIAQWHMFRRQHRDKLKWNFACDFAVNDLVMKEFTLPKGCLYDNSFADKSAEYIYNKLPDPPKLMGSLLDSHDEWENGGSGSGSGGENGENGEIDRELEQEWRENIAQAATQARMQGKMPAHLKTLVDGMLQPKLDWKTMLRDMITSVIKNNYRWIPPNKKHLWREIYLPATTGEEISIAAAIDTSGSISDEEIKEFISEIKGICDSFDSYTIYLYSCDSRIHQEWELHPFDPLPTVFEGRGGTSFVDPIEDARKKSLDISAFVYLTDLWGTFPDEPPFPVIWVCVDEDKKAPFGTTIYLPRNK